MQMIYYSDMKFNLIEYIIEALLWIIGGFLIFKFGGWNLVIAIWVLLFANNIMTFRRYREHKCTQKTEE
jgi:hypothetical protein